MDSNGIEAFDVQSYQPSENQRRGRLLRCFYSWSAPRCIAFFVVLLMVLCFMYGSYAHAASNTSAAMNGSVTDTQNLLGSQSAKISDEIASTQQKTGVHVRLLFLADFNDAKDPDRWVADVLESTQPKANTVMLAVASNDGRLVVAVSKNSDRWLQEQKNVDALSQAALQPLQNSGSPDWAGCAIGFMEKIKSIHHDRQVIRRTVVIVLCVLLLVLACVVSCLVFVHHSRKNSHARHGRAHASR